MRVAPIALLSLLALVGIVAAANTGCVVAKDARIAAENALDPKTTQEFAWGRVECGEGQVCSEVAVARVDVHDGGTADEGGSVDVTLENKTLESVAVQVMLEMFDDDGRRIDRSNFQDVALAPRSSSVLTLWRDVDGGKLVIHLRARGA